MGSDHSLTDMNQTSRGRNAIGSGLGQPQSQTITFALGLPRCTPSAIAAFTSARTCAGLRFLHRGHPACWPCEGQLVRFSEAVMVNTPPSFGTLRKTCSSALESQFRTAGVLVHMV